MSINFDAIRADMNRLNKKTTKDSSNNDLIWKPEKEHIIRILPYPHDPTDSLRRLYFHYNLTDKQILSPITYGLDDPIVQWAKKLQAEGNKDSWKRGKNLEPKLRVFAPIIIRGEEQKGVKFYGFSEAVYKDLCKFLNSGDYGDISDLNAGNDIYIEYHPKVGDGYPSTTIMIKPNKTPAFTDASLGNSILSSIPKIDDLFKMPTKEELISILENYLYPTKSISFSETQAVPASTIATAANVVTFPSTSPNIGENASVYNAMNEFERLLNSK
jgi:hypothetical protein